MHCWNWEPFIYGWSANSAFWEAGSAQKGGISSAKATSWFRSGPQNQLLDGSVELCSSVEPAHWPFSSLSANENWVREFRSINLPSCISNCWNWSNVCTQQVCAEREKLLTLPNNILTTKSKRWEVCLYIWLWCCSFFPRSQNRQTQFRCTERSRTFPCLPDGDLWTPVLGWKTGLPSLHLNLDDATPFVTYGSATHVTTPVRKILNPFRGKKSCQNFMKGKTKKTSVRWKFNGRPSGGSRILVRGAQRSFYSRGTLLNFEKKKWGQGGPGPRAP